MKYAAESISGVRSHKKAAFLSKRLTVQSRLCLSSNMCSTFYIFKDFTSAKRSRLVFFCVLKWLGAETVYRVYIKHVN